MLTASSDTVSHTVPDRFHRFVEQLTKGLQEDDDILKNKVLLEINEDFHQADKLNFALESDILQQLLSCFSHKEAHIRELASRAVLKIANTEMGRVVFVQNNLIEVTASLFDDPEKQIRNNAYTCFINLAQFTFGIQSVIDADILRVLVEKLVLEKETEILILIL